MLLRISLVVVLLAAIGAGVMGYLEVSKQIPALVQQRDTENQQKHQYYNELTTTNKILVQTRTDLAQTQQELADTKDKLTKTIAAVDKETKRANDLADKLTQTTQDRDDARNQLAAYTTTGLTAKQVSDLNADYHKAQETIQAMNDEKVVLTRANQRLKNELDQLTNPDTAVKLRADLSGKIVEVDPKWDFVVLNVGEDQGIIQNGELLVSREGKLVAKVIVRSVQKDHCIANLVPGWNFGPMIEGDVVTPAHPAPASAS